MENIMWVLRQPVMFVLYAFLVVTLILEELENANERKVNNMKINNALRYICKIKMNWIVANTNQKNVLCGLEFMQRTFDKSISDAIHVARTEPDSVEAYMDKVHDELLSICATPSAKVLLDEVFDV